MSALLQAVSRARKRRDSAAEAFRVAVVDACKAHSLREVGRAAGVSFQRIHQIVNGGRDDDEK